MYSSSMVTTEVSKEVLYCLSNDAMTSDLE